MCDEIVNDNICCVFVDYIVKVDESLVKFNNVFLCVLECCVVVFYKYC